MGGSGWLWLVMITWKAPMIDAEPRVAMKALICSFTTRKPLTKPMNGRDDDGRDDRRHHRPAVLDLAAGDTTIADMLIMAPIDRSNTPAASGIRTARPSMATMACSDAIECRVAVVRNLSGVQIPKTTMKMSQQVQAAEPVEPGVELAAGPLRRGSVILPAARPFAARSCRNHLSLSAERLPGHVGHGDGLPPEVGDDAPVPQDEHSM